VIFGVVKLQIIAPVPGQKWIIGHTVLVDEEVGQQLIDDGVAIVHPTVSTPAPPHKCPCEDESNEPCEKCQEKATQNELIESTPQPRQKAKAKTTSKK
jgi:hypothetical protein